MDAEAHREIESKFDVDGQLVIDDLSALSGVIAVERPTRQRLDAEYFDTADLSLLHAGFGLQRRTGGSDQGWQLEIAESLGDRLEVHRPLGRSPTRVPWRCGTS